MQDFQQQNNQENLNSKEQQISGQKHASKYFGSIFLGIVIGAFIVYAYFSYNNNPNISKQSLSKNTQNADLAAASAFLKFKEIKDSFIPSGIPDIYGKELNISFDEVQDGINKVAPFDPTYGPNKIILTDADLKRYIKIGSSIACEYCCGATTLVFENGEAACGCEHSQMMRGLTAYLIKNHPEISDEEILKELSQWKITYFPKQMLSAELQKRIKAGETGIEEVLEEFPEFLPQMVGGC